MKKITSLKAKSMGYGPNGQSPEKRIKGNTLSASGIDPHKLLGTRPKMKARHK